MIWECNSWLDSNFWETQTCVWHCDFGKPINLPLSLIKRGRNLFLIRFSDQSCCQPFCSFELLLFPDNIQEPVTFLLSLVWWGRTLSLALEICEAGSAPLKSTETGSPSNGSDGHGNVNPCGIAGTGVTGTGTGDQILIRDIPVPVLAGDGSVTRSLMRDVSTFSPLSTTLHYLTGDINVNCHHLNDNTQ